MSVFDESGFPREGQTPRQRIGVDLDNTLVCYDTVFWMLAMERGWIDDSVPVRKERVRDALRAAGREADWTALQGEVYGPRMVQAVPFPGAVDLFRELSKLGHSVCIISHRSRQPYAGPAWDLHESARTWLDSHGFFGRGAGLTAAQVFLETARVDKLQRIGSQQLDWFVDDLPELLAAPDFPSQVRRILFDPHHHRPALPEAIRIVDRLAEIPDAITQSQEARDGNS